MRIAVVTPWLNHLDLAEDYFAALACGPAPDETIVVDNASDPPLAFAALTLTVNAGFSAGSNRGLAHATSDIVVFLNNDIAATRSGWLADIAAQVQPGVLAGAVMRHDAHGSVDGQALPYLDGWCLAGMRDDLLALRGFDETFAEPAYYSDNDLCLRARASGMRLAEVPTGLQHKGGATSQPGFNAWVADATRINRALFQARARGLLAA